MNKICYVNSEGNLCIVHPVSKENIEQILGEMTEQEYRDHIYITSIPNDAQNVREIDDLEIPDGRYFRNAWIDDGQIKVDIDKARVIHMDNLRIMRNDKLKNLDIEYMKASEQNNTNEMSIIASKKQDLRDMPQNTDLSLISDLKELQEFIPEILQ